MVEFIVEVLYILLLLFELVCATVGIYVLYWLFRAALVYVNRWRSEQGKDLFSDKQCFIFALFTALAFLL